MRNLRHYLVSLVLGFAFTLSGADSLLEDFFEDEGFSSFKVSPSGRFVSYMERDGLIPRLHVRDFETNKAYSLDGERDSGFGSYVWAGDETIALMEFYNAAGQSPRGYISTYSYKLKRKNADYNRPSRLSMEKGHKDIIPQILSGVPSQPDFLLIAQPTVSFRNNPGRSRSDFSKARATVHKLNLKTRDVVTVVDEPLYDAWIPDSLGRLRLALKIFGSNKGIYYRKTEGDTWRRLDLAEDALSPGFLPGDEQILITHTPKGGDKIVLQGYDPEKGKWSSKPISDPVYDVTAGGAELPSLQTDPKTGKLLGIHYSGAKKKTIWLDPSYAKVQQILEKQFPGAVVSIVGMVTPIDSILVEVYSDVLAPVVLLYNLKSMELSVFKQKSPSIVDYVFNEIKPVEFTARDGATIHGYLTLPANWSKERPPPLVVAVKGGPAGRSTWANGIEFFESQWFSQKGCSVLQINYRGSTGYGETYSGDEMMLFAAQKGVEDVVDGTRWAIQNGYADKSEVVLMGASFGGYVSGMAPAVEPDLFKITIPAMGVYDWLTMAEYDRTKSHPFVWEILKPKYGDCEALVDEYKKWSPAENAHKIKIPMLILAGIYDARVDMEQVKIFESALDNANVDYESYHYTRGGHGFGDQKGWVDYFQKIEKFMRQHNIL